jgi:hypothetical protein
MPPNLPSGSGCPLQADTDPTFNFDADTGPTFHCHADSDTAPILRAASLELLKGIHQLKDPSGLHLNSLLFQFLFHISTPK